MFASSLNKQKNSMNTAMRTIMRKCHNSPTTRSFREIMFDPKIERITFTCNKNELVGTATCLIVTIFGGLYLIHNKLNEIENEIENYKKKINDKIDAFEIKVENKIEDFMRRIYDKVYTLENEKENLKIKAECVFDMSEVLEKENKILKKTVFDLNNQVAWFQGFLHMKWNSK